MGSQQVGRGHQRRNGNNPQDRQHESGTGTLSRVRDNRVEKHRSTTKDATKKLVKTFAANSATGSQLRDHASSELSYENDLPIHHKDGDHDHADAGLSADHKIPRDTVDLVTLGKVTINMRLKIHKGFGLTQEVEPEVGTVEGLGGQGRKEVARALRQLLFGLEEDIAAACQVRREDYKRFWKGQDLIDDLQSDHSQYWPAKFAEFTSEMQAEIEKFKQEHNAKEEQSQSTISCLRADIQACENMRLKSVIRQQRSREAQIDARDNQQGQTERRDYERRSSKPSDGRLRARCERPTATPWRERSASSEEASLK